MNVADALLSHEPTYFLYLRKRTHRPVLKSHGSRQLERTFSVLHVRKSVDPFRSAVVLPDKFIRGWIGERTLIHRDKVVNRVFMFTFPVGDLLTKFVRFLKHFLARKCHLRLRLLLHNPISARLTRNNSSHRLFSISKKSGIYLLLICLFLFSLALFLSYLN